MKEILPAGQTASDPFANLSKLRLSQDFAANLAVKKALLTVPVRKPNRQQFIRVHPDEAYRLQTAVLELKDTRETYLVAHSGPSFPAKSQPRRFTR